MEQKTLEYNENIYRVKKMNAIEALALRSALRQANIDWATGNVTLYSNSQVALKVLIY